MRLQKTVGGNDRSALQAVVAEMRAEIADREAKGWVAVPRTQEVTLDPASLVMTFSCEMLPPDHPDAARLRSERLDLRAKE